MKRSKAICCCAVIVLCGSSVGLLRLHGRRLLPVEARPVYSIGMYSGRSPYQLTADRRVKNPILQAGDVTDVPAVFVADPFMIALGHTWYMFFEVMNSESKQGDIAFATSSDCIHWKYEHVVIDKEYHLSYPYVFLSQGHFYMIPESHQARAVLLFEAQQFPDKWVVADTLLRGDEFVDSSIFEAYGRWWMYVASRTRPGQLRLFHSERLRGPWVEHPRSPVVTCSLETSRPGGRVISYENHFVRFAQNDYPTYGREVNAFEIVKLTATEYEERPVEWNPVLSGEGQEWTTLGMHHLDPHMIDPATWFACVDGQVMSRRFSLASWFGDRSVRRTTD